MSGRVLVLAGTREARILARRIAEWPGVSVIASLAGRTDAPEDLGVETRVGGFGGTEGLARWCHDQAITLIVDATHPYARRIQGAAVMVSASLGIAHIRLERPPWPNRPGWRHCADLGAALQSLPVGARVLVTSGTAGLEALDNRSDIAVIVRTISNPGPMPSHVAWLRGRPPFSMEAEVATFAHHAITHLITKNAGGTGIAKLDAAELRGVGVLMIDRPAATAPPHAEDMDEALRLAWKVHST